MDPAYDQSMTATDRAAAADPWDDPAIAAYLEEADHALRERLDQALAHIDDQLRARDRLHDEFMAELEWQVKVYERELDRLTGPCTPRPEERNRITVRLRELRQEIRDERRQHWQDRQQLERERRDVVRERAALDDDVSELLY